MLGNRAGLLLLGGTTGRFGEFHGASEDNLVFRVLFLSRSEVNVGCDSLDGLASQNTECASNAVGQAKTGKACG